DIAGKLFLSEGTVRNYLSAAIAKTGVRNRVEAVRVADERGWLGLPLFAAGGGHFPPPAASRPRAAVPGFGHQVANNRPGDQNRIRGRRPGARRRWRSARGDPDRSGP